ncbi:hypothetical protein NTGBS_40028 [Candidatus Nitrotoga sp. BS]|nr:hypothetical protein NTGBS_40028 [Candidatus Nitrotoga sp. BS]
MVCLMGLAKFSYIDQRYHKKLHDLYIQVLLDI